MNFVRFLQALFSKKAGSVYYIGGSDVLPPPLKGAEEQAALEALERGEESARQQLVEHNLRLVGFSRRCSRKPWPTA